MLGPIKLICSVDKWYRERLKLTEHSRGPLTQRRALVICTGFPPPPGPVGTGDWSSCAVVVCKVRVRLVSATF